MMLAIHWSFESGANQLSAIARSIYCRLYKLEAERAAYNLNLNIRAGALKFLEETHVTLSSTDVVLNACDNDDREPGAGKAEVRV